MKRIEKDELFTNLSGFLNTKGIELKEGSYSKRIQQGCSILADLINMGQDGLGKAKTKAEASIDRLRQTIHEKTAPRNPKPTAEETKAEEAENYSTETPPTPEPEVKASGPKAKKTTAKKKVAKKKAV